MTISAFFKDEHGKVVLAQPPNPPLLGWIVVTIIRVFVQSSGLAWLATAFLFTWAFLELYQGASCFRRLLGLVVLAAISVAHFT